MNVTGSQTQSNLVLGPLPPSSYQQQQQQQQQSNNTRTNNQGQGYQRGYKVRIVIYLVYLRRELRDFDR